MHTWISARIQCLCPKFLFCDRQTSGQSEEHFLDNFTFRILLQAGGGWWPHFYSINFIQKRYLWRNNIIMLWVLQSKFFIYENIHGEFSQSLWILEQLFEDMVELFGISLLFNFKCGKVYHEFDNVWVGGVILSYLSRWIRQNSNITSANILP